MIVGNRTHTEGRAVASKSVVAQIRDPFCKRG